MDLEQVADELYEVPPEDFVALRKERQDAAKAEGDKALAKEIGALPKPSAAAWACNLLVREQRPEIENLVELGDLLREAQENLAGDQLRALDVQRRQLVTVLTRQARGLASGRGHPVSTSVATQVEETLRAAMADPDAGRALLTGRLTSPMTYSGLGTTVARPDLRLVHPPRKAERPAAPAPPTGRVAPEKPARKEAAGESAADRRAREQEARRRAAEEKRRRELAAARAAAEEAGAAAEEATATLAEHARQAAELAARHTELQARVDQLADELAEAERAAADTASALKREERRRAAAQREADEAIEVRDRAGAHLAALDEG